MSVQDNAIFLSLEESSRGGDELVTSVLVGKAARRAVCRNQRQKGEEDDGKKHGPIEIS